MATFLSLPPELLIEILSFSRYDKPEWTMEQRMNGRLSHAIMLCRMSRVHSSLTDLARSLIVRELHVERYGDPTQDTQLERLSSPPWDTFTIKHLALRAGFRKGDLREAFLLRFPEDVSLFAHIASVHCQGGILEWYLLSLIKTLETAHLYDLEIINSPSASNVIFPSLRRLTSHGVRISIQLDTRVLFSPSSMPKLAHLAIRDQQEPLVDLGNPSTSIASQIRSLAIWYIDPKGSPLTSAFPNLRHLSIHALSEYGRLDPLRGLSLETLFVPTFSLSYGNTSTSEQMVNIAKGEHEFIKSKKVYLCGRGKWHWGNRVPAPAELPLFGWCSESVPPYRGFKGPGS